VDVCISISVIQNIISCFHTRTRKEQF